MTARRIIARASWSPRTYFKLAAHCHAETRRFCNDNWHPVSA